MIVHRQRAATWAMCWSARINFKRPSSIIRINKRDKQELLASVQQNCLLNKVSHSIKWIDVKHNKHFCSHHQWSFVSWQHGIIVMVIITYFVTSTTPVISFVECSFYCVHLSYPTVYNLVFVTSFLHWLCCAIIIHQVIINSKKIYCLSDKQQF